MKAVSPQRPSCEISGGYGAGERPSGPIERRAMRGASGDVSRSGDALSSMGSRTDLVGIVDADADVDEPERKWAQR